MANSKSQSLLLRYMQNRRRLILTFQNSPKGIKNILTTIPNWKQRAEQMDVSFIESLPYDTTYKNLDLIINNFYVLVEKQNNELTDLSQNFKSLLKQPKITTRTNGESKKYYHKYNLTQRKMMELLKEHYPNIYYSLKEKSKTIIEESYA